MRLVGAVTRDLNSVRNRSIWLARQALPAFALGGTRVDQAVDAFAVALRS